MVATVFTPTVALNTDDANPNTSFRIVCKLSAASNGQLQVTFASSVAKGGLSTSHCSIGKWDGVAGSANCTTTPVELKFGGLSGFGIGQSATITSDLTDHSASFSLASTDFVVVIHDEAGSAGELFSNGNTDVDTYFGAGASWNSQTVAGYTQLAGADYAISKVETNDAPLISLAAPPAPTASAGRSVQTAIDSLNFFIESQNAGNIITASATVSAAGNSGDLINTKQTGAMFLITVASVTVNTATVQFAINAKDVSRSTYFPYIKTSIDGISASTQAMILLYVGGVSSAFLNANDQLITMPLPNVFQVVTSMTITTTASMSGTASLRIDYSKVM